MAKPVSSALSLSDRAGSYERQIGGYTAFIPRSLPPRPQLNIDRSLSRLLSGADRALAALDSAILTLPDPDLFLFMYVRKEAVLSSQIEGTQSSLDDLIRAEEHIPGKDLPDDVGEVSNYVKAMNHGLSRLSSLPVSGRLIREIHEKLMEGVRGGDRSPGEFRKDQVWIGAHGASIREAIFVPPPKDYVDQAIRDLEIYMHSENENDDPPLIRVGLAHAQFETIHPFSDGNGRCGRLLITFLLCEQKLMSRPVLYLSYYLKINRLEYYERLQAVRDAGDWEGWTAFFLQGVQQVATQATVVARKIIRLREDHRQIIIDNFGAQVGKALTLLEILYKRPAINVNSAKRVLGVSYPNANAIVYKLKHFYILREITGQVRNRFFIYQSYIDLFADL